MWSEMSYHKYYNRNDELEPEYCECDFIDNNTIYYGLYEDLTNYNTFAVEEAFWCEEFN